MKTKPEITLVVLFLRSLLTKNFIWTRCRWRCDLSRLSSSPIQSYVIIELISGGKSGFYCEIHILSSIFHLLCFRVEDSVNETSWIITWLTLLMFFWYRMNRTVLFILVRWLGMLGENELFVLLRLKIKKRTWCIMCRSLVVTLEHTCTA